MGTHRAEWAGRLYCAARKYCLILWVPGEVSTLYSVSDSNRRLAMASLSNLSKFLGVYNTWKNVIENAGLKWSDCSSEDIVIDRLTRVQKPDEITQWIRGIKAEVPTLSSFMDFAACTGIRFVEAVNSYNLITKLDAEQLHDYYDANRELLQHYKYRDMFMRRSKKVYVSFIHRNLIDAVRESKPMSKNMIKKRIRKAELSSRFGDLREYWATTMTRTLRQPEIDFLQGRISSSVFMRHYFNPAWIADLKARTLKVEQEILAQIS